MSTIFSQTVQVNIKAGSAPPTVNVSQYDIGRPIIFEVYDGTSKIELTDSSEPVALYIAKDDTTETYSYTCGVRLGNAYLATKPPMTRYAGKHRVTLLIYNNDSLIGSAYFYLEVEEKVLKDPAAWTSKDVIPAIIDAGRENLKETREAAADALTSSVHADAFEAESSAHAHGEGTWIDSEGNEQTVTDPLSSKHYAEMSESYAKGTANKRIDEEHDNAEYYMQQAFAYKETARYYEEALLSIGQLLGGRFTIMGSISYSDLQALTNPYEGQAYVMTDAFLTDNTFEQGPNQQVNKGTIVYRTYKHTWDFFPTIPTVNVYEMTGATDTDDGVGGFVPQPFKGQQDNFLKGDGSWRYIFKASDLLSIVPTLIYPIGSTYFTTEETDPKEYFGGTWDEIETDEAKVTIDGTEYSVKIENLHVWRRIA